MKYVVDRVEKDIVVLESLDGKDKLEINKDELDFKVFDGVVLIKEKDGFALDEETTQKRKEDISSRFSKLKKKK